MMKGTWNTGPVSGHVHTMLTPLGQEPAFVGGGVAAYVRLAAAKAKTDRNVLSIYVLHEVAN